MREHDRIRDDLVAYLSGDLDAREAAEMTAHLETCGACGRELESLRNLWQALGRVPDELPDPRMSARFYDALKACEDPPHRSRARGETLQGKHTRGESYDRFGWIVGRHPAIQFALVLAVLVVGGFIGYGIGGNGARNDEMVQLREEVRSVNRLLIVSLLQQQTATERLQGVSWSYRADPSDPEITAVLLETLSQDPNVNVRLAALDALTRNLEEPAVRGALVKALEKQSSPMLQLALLDVVVGSDMTESAAVLRELRDRQGVNDAVKKRVEEALQHFNI